MRRIVAAILSFALILLFVAGCGKNRPKRPPVLVSTESDFVFDTQVNNSDDLIELLKPRKGKSTEYDVGGDMLGAGFNWNDKSYLTRTPIWPEIKDDPAMSKAMEAAKKRYELALEMDKGKQRKDDMIAIGKYYGAFATTVKPDRSQQSADNWKQYLRRQGREGFALRKKLETGAFEMATVCDVTVPGQIVASWKEAEKDGSQLILTVSKDPASPTLASLKPDKIKEFDEGQTIYNFSAACLEYRKEAGDNPSVEGMRTYMKQKAYPIYAKMVDDKSILLVDFTQPKVQVVAVLTKFVTKQGVAVVLQSGAPSRINEALIPKLPVAQ